MMGKWWKRCDRQTDRRTDGRTDGLNQSYSCLVAARNAYDRVVFLLFHKSHDASVLYPKIHHFITEICTSAHFSYMAVHCGIVAWCIVRFVRCVYIRACKGLVWWCLYVQWLSMMTSSDGNIFHVTGYLCGEFTDDSPVNSPYKGQLRGALMIILICAWIYSWVNNRDAGDLTPSRSLWSHCNEHFRSEANLIIPVSANS